MIKIIKEFKDFAVKGNMFDIAIGVIIGASFNNVVDTLVRDILLPPLTLLTNSKSSLIPDIIIREKKIDQFNNILNDEISINFGKFLSSIIDFLIISFTIFLVIKFLNKIRIKAEDPNDESVSTPANIELLSKISKELTEIRKKIN